MKDNKSEYPEKINVWVRIIGNHLIDPFFIHENLYSEMYDAN